MLNIEKLVEYGDRSYKDGVLNYRIEHILLIISRLRGSKF